MRRFRQLIPLLLCLSALAGCGYHFAGREQILPGHIATIAIPIFRNDTTKPFLESNLTNQVRSRFSRFSGVELVEPDEPYEGRLLGRITSYEVRASAFDALDNIIEYKITMQVEVVLKQAETGKILWKNLVVWKGTFPGGSDVNVLEINEQKAIQEIGERTASEILYRMLDDF
jgi:outer membrane lipopolysaccharide assembly protein LptE/RlpB